MFLERKRESERRKGEKGGKMKERWKERKGERRERWIDKDRKEIKVGRKEGRVKEKKDGLIKKEKVEIKKGRVKGKTKKEKVEKVKEINCHHSYSIPENHKLSHSLTTTDIHTKHQILTQPGSPRQQSKPSVTDTALQPHTTQSHTSHHHSPSHPHWAVQSHHV